MRYAVLYQDEDGAWVATIPSLPGCISQGSTKQEAAENVREAMEVWIESMRDRGEPIPPELGSPELVRLPAA